MFSRIIENPEDIHAERAWEAISTPVGVSDDRMGEVETLSGEVSISAMNVAFLNLRKVII